MKNIYRLVIGAFYITLLASRIWSAGTSENLSAGQKMASAPESRLGPLAKTQIVSNAPILTVTGLITVDTVNIPRSNPLLPYLSQYDWSEIFYVDKENENYLLVHQKLYSIHNQYHIDLIARKALQSYVPRTGGKLKMSQEMILEYHKQGKSALSGFRKLAMYSTFRAPKPLRTPTKGPDPIQGEQGLIWEGISSNPALIAQVWHVKPYGSQKGSTLGSHTGDLLFGDSYEITIVPIRDFKALAGIVPPRAMVGPDGFSLIDGRDTDGYDHEGFDRLGWNRQGVNRSGERWSGRIAGGRQGPGILSMTDGASYVGTYRDDLRDGWGALLKSEGGEIQSWEKGTLKESFPLGGKILSPVREWIFLGRAAKGVLVDGKGRAISADGAWRIPEGTFRGGRLVEGTMESPDGTLYVGRFANDQLVQGTIRGASGWTYTGGLADGKPEGRGLVLLPDGTRYEGEFKSGTYDGQGVLSRPDGEKFEGTFRDGKPHGMGIYFNGETVERCEYYDGKRIDQAFLIKQENEKQLEALRQEREKLAKEKADQAEMARLAAERAAAEQKAQASKSSNKLIAGIFGVGAALAGGSVGMSGAEAALFGAKVAGDVAKGDASMSGSKSTAQAIADSRTGGAAAAGAPGTAGSGAAQKFAKKPNHLDSVSKLANGAWQKYSGDGQLYPFFQQAQTYYDAYLNAIAQGYSEAECNKTYDIHRQSAEHAISVWRGFGLDK